MENKPDYKLANIHKKEIALANTRQEILQMESEQALDSILGAPSPATLIQSFPDQDLYYLMHKIGVDDFLLVLSRATSEQWEYILDIEVWDNDRIDIKNTSKALDVLFQADPKRLVRWIIKEKPDFIEYFYFKNIEIKIREHDEVPPDEEGFITFDDKFYFRFPNISKDDDSIPELIEKMLKMVADMDLSVFHGLMLETTSIIPAEIEEEQFRLKNIRLAEKGFLPFHEAIGIYQPITQNKLKERPAIKKQPGFNPDLPMPPQFHTQFIKGDNLFVKSFDLLEPGLKFELQTELAALINKLISADRIKIREKEDMEKAINKVCSYLCLGIETLLEKENTISLEASLKIIEHYFLEDLFRTGSAQGIQLKTRALNFYNTSFLKTNNLPLSFLDQLWLGIIGGLFVERPLFFDNYKTTALYKDFQAIWEINQTSDELEKIIETDKILNFMDLDTTSFKEGILTYKSLYLTLWAKDRLGLDPSLEPIPLKPFKDFFIDLFTGEEKGKIDTIKKEDFILWLSRFTEKNDHIISDYFLSVAKDLFEELENEYAFIEPEHIDPRFFPHFLLTK